MRVLLKPLSYSFSRLNRPVCLDFSHDHVGIKTAICELPFARIASDEYGGAGGTCVLRGCVPKKLMVYGGEFAEAFRDSKAFG